MKYRKVKAKCEWSSKEKPERKCKQAQVEEMDAGPSNWKRLKKMLEEKSNGMAELLEMLGVGLKAIMDAFSKQRMLLQELVKLDVDKVELIQLDQWVLKDEEDEEEETEEGAEVEVEKELLELVKEREENRDGLEEEEEAEE